jgi:predicted Co/Zn/Cd cation transporter (cation efflux family)
MTALLIIAVLVDLALAALLVAVSGFVTGGGPESTNAHGFAAAAYWAAVVVCIAAAFAGFILNRKGKTAAALIAAWVPPAGALVATLLPGPY